MEITREINEKHQAVIVVEVEEDAFDSAKKRAARQIAKKVKIPGFRPGKAPYPVVVRHVGEQRILDDALDILVNDIYPKIIEESNIKPYGPGTLEKVISLEPPKLKFIVPLMPEVDLGDYKKLRKPYKPPKVTKKEVKEFLDNLRESQAIIQPVERPAKVGDQVTLKIKAVKKNVEDGGKEVIINEQSIPFTIKTKTSTKSESTPEWPYDGFSNELVGLKVGDKKEIEHVYGDDTQFSDLKNSTVQFAFTVESVKEKKLPKLDDDFVSLFGSYPDVTAFKADIKLSLEQQKTDKYNQEYDQTILEKAVKQATFKYPPEAIETEQKYIVDNLKSRLTKDNMDLDLYLKARGISYEDLLDEIKPNAEKQLKESLFLTKLIKQENIEVTKEEIRRETENTVNYLAQTLDKKDLRKLESKDVLNNIIGSVEYDLIMTKGREYLHDVFSGKFDETSDDEDNSEKEADDAGEKVKSKKVSSAKKTTVKKSATEKQPIGKSKAKTTKSKQKKEKSDGEDEGTK